MTVIFPCVKFVRFSPPRLPAEPSDPVRLIIRPLVADLCKNVQRGKKGTDSGKTF